MEDFPLLLDLTWRAIHSIAGRDAPDRRIRDCNELAIKLFYHASTVHRLRQGTELHLPAIDPDRLLFYDFASATVISRSAFETYLRMFELFFEPVTDDEKELRHAAWLLSGLIKFKGMETNDPSLAAQLKRHRLALHEARGRIEATTAFGLLKPKAQKWVLAGNYDKVLSRSRPQRAAAAGFGPKTIDMVYKHMSGYVHADGFCGIQTAQIDTREKQSQALESCVTLHKMLLAKQVLDYCKAFPPAQSCCQACPKALFQAEFSAGVAGHLE